MMTIEKDKGMFQHLAKYLPVYIFIGGIIANYVLTTSRVSQLDYRVTKVEAEQESSREILNQMRIDVGIIKDNVSDIKKKLQ